MVSGTVGVSLCTIQLNYLTTWSCVQSVIPISTLEKYTLDWSWERRIKVPYSSLLSFKGHSIYTVIFGTILSQACKWPAVMHPAIWDFEPCCIHFEIFVSNV